MSEDRNSNQQIVDLTTEIHEVYKNGKIYKIDLGERGVYYGCTRQTLQSRLAQHISQCKDQSTPFLKACSETKDPKITLVKKFPCCNRAELMDEERRVISEAVGRGENVLNLFQRDPKEKLREIRKKRDSSWGRKYRKRKKEENAAEFNAKQNRAQRIYQAKRKAEGKKCFSSIIGDRHRQSGTYRCEPCAFNFPDSSSLKRHLGRQIHLLKINSIATEQDQEMEEESKENVEMIDLCA